MRTLLGFLLGFALGDFTGALLTAVFMSEKGR